MSETKELTIVEKQKIAKLFSEGMSTLEISKKLCWDNWMIKKAAENITELWIQSKGKGFKNLPPRDERKLKRIGAKQPLLTSEQIFEEARIEGIKKVKLIIDNLRKTLWQPLLTKTNILKCQNWA